MKFLIAVVCLAAIAVADHLPVDHPDPLPFHYSSNSDVDGSYFFNYATADSSKSESRTADGTVHGGFQYVDTDGILQKVQYKAGEEGVQVLASNLPVGNTDPVKDTPEVLRATEEHYHAVQKSLQLIERARIIREEFARRQGAISHYHHL